MKNTITTIMLSICTLAIASPTFAAQVQTTQEAKAGSAQAFAQASLRRHVNVTYNVLSTIIGTVAGSVEFKATQPFSVGITGAYLFNNYAYKKNQNLKYYNAGLFGTYAFNKNIMTSGWLVQPTVAYSHIDWTSNKTQPGGAPRIKTISAHSVSLSLPFIYQWMWDGGFNMRLGAGPSYSWFSETEDKPSGYIANHAISGLGITSLFTLGYAF